MNIFFLHLGIWVSNKTFKTELYKYVLKPCKTTRERWKRENEKYLRSPLINAMEYTGNALKGQVHLKGNSKEKPLISVPNIQWCKSLTSSQGVKTSLILELVGVRTHGPPPTLWHLLLSEDAFRLESHTSISLSFILFLLFGSSSDLGSRTSCMIPATC